MENIKKVSRAEFEKIELQEALNTFRVQYTLVIQVFTVLIIADVSVIGYAIHEKLAGIIFLGMIFPIAMLYAKRVLHKRMVPIVYTALLIENRQEPVEGDGLVYNYLSFLNTPGEVDRLIEISGIEKKEERIKQVKQFFEERKARTIGYFLFLILIGHIIGPVLLYYYFSFKYF